MALPGELLRDRMREAFGTDSQEIIGQKLNMSQGNVSKMLSGVQQPALETIYHIAKKYDVSVDWLLGLSQVKTTGAKNQELSYVSMAKIISLLLQCDTVDINANNAPNDTRVMFMDPLLSHLLDKCKRLYEADPELLQDWLEKKLPLFAGLSFLPEEAWESDAARDMDFVDLMTDAEWIEAYNLVKQMEPWDES